MKAAQDNSSGRSPVNSIQILQAPLIQRPGLPRVMGDGGQAKRLTGTEEELNSNGVVLPCIHVPFRPGHPLTRQDNGRTARQRLERTTRLTLSEVQFDAPKPGVGLARRRLLAWAKTPKHINCPVYREMVRQHCFITLRHYDMFARGAGGRTTHLRRSTPASKGGRRLPEVGDNTKGEDEDLATLPKDQTVNHIILHNQGVDESPQDPLVGELQHAQGVNTPLDLQHPRHEEDTETTDQPNGQDQFQQLQQQQQQGQEQQQLRKHHTKQKQQQQHQQQLTDVLARYEETPGLRTRTSKSDRALGNVVSLRQLRHMLLDTPRPLKLQDCHNYYPS